VLCGIVVRVLMYCVAYLGVRLCVVWNSGEGCYV